MAADNKIKNLKFENNSGVLLITNYWLAWVYYEDKNENESEIINNDEKESQKNDIKQDQILGAE